MMRENLDRARDEILFAPGDRYERTLAFEWTADGHVAIIENGHREVPMRTLSPIEVRRLVWWLDRRPS